FSTADELVRPLIDEGPYSYQRVHVEDQRRDPDSLLNWMVHMIRVRKECPEIGWGDWEPLQTGNAAVLSKRYDWPGNSLVVLHNFSDQPQTVEIEPDVPGGELLVNLQAGERSRADEPGRHRLALDPYGYRWYRVGGLQHILVRQRG